MLALTVHRTKVWAARLHAYGCKYGLTLSKVASAPSESSAAVLRSNILVFSFSIVPGLSRWCFVAALSCGAAACNVYSPDLLNGALSTGGSVGLGGSGTT